MRCVSTRVLPEPAPARISSGPSPCVTASRWGSLRPPSRLVDRAASARRHASIRPLRGYGAGGRPRPSLAAAMRPLRRGPRDAARGSRPRRHAAVTHRRSTRSARVEPGAAARARPERHYLEGSRGRRRDVPARRSTRSTSARAGSRRCASAPGCVGLLHRRLGARRPLPRRTGRGPTAELRAMRTDEIADTLGQRPRPRADGALRPGAARARRASSATRDALDARRARRGGSARARWPTQLAGGMALFDDRGFYKRAQIVAARPRARRRRALRRPRPADDLRRQPRPPRPALRRRARATTTRLAAHIDAGRLLPPGPQEREIRACAVHACELLAQRARRSRRASSTTGCGTAARRPQYKARPRHRCRDGLLLSAGASAAGAGSGACGTARRSGAQPSALGRVGRRRRSARARQLGDARARASPMPRRQPADRVGDRVGQVDPVGVRALRARARRRAPAWPGLPTTVEFGGDVVDDDACWRRSSRRGRR